MSSKFKLFNFVVVVVSSAFMHYGVLAQNRVIEIDSINVTRSRSVKLVEQSAPVQTIRAQKLELLGINDLSEALNTFSGVQINNYGGVGGMKTVSVRSLGAHHTAVSYDGVVMSNAQGGTIDIGDVMLNNIDEISLSIGQSDDIFQSARSFTLSGLLMLKSKAPQFYSSNVLASAGIEVGSFGLYNPSINFAYKITDRWKLSLNSNWMISDGEYPFTLVNNETITTEWRKNSDVNRIIGEMNLYGDVGRSGKLYFKGNYLNSERGLPGGVVYYNDDATERLWDEDGQFQSGYRNEFNDRWALDTNVKYSYAWTRYIDVDNKYTGGMLDDRYTQQEYYASAAVRYTPTDNLTFTFAQDLFENRLVTDMSEGDDSSISPNRFNVNSSLAAQYKLPRLTVTASLLAIYNHEWLSDDSSGSVAPDRKRLSPSLSGSYKLLKSSDLRVRASVKDSYRVPTFNELYYARFGNTSILPERAMQYNMGLTYGGKLFDYTTISVDGYYNRIEDKIIAIPTMFIWTMINLGQVDITGLDFNLNSHFTIASQLKCNLTANYSYQHAVDATEDSKTYGHQIAYTPRHSSNVSLTVLNDWFDLGYSVAMVGDRYSTNQNIESNLIAGYAEQNITLGRDFVFKKLDFRVQAKVLNVADVNYDVIKFYPMPGRQYRVSIKFNYK